MVCIKYDIYERCGGGGQRGREGDTIFSSKI